jgi:hypothetical protein
VKSATMISWDFDPFYIRGGSAYATRRLAEQLTGLGIETRVLFPDRPNTRGRPQITRLLKPTPVRIHDRFRSAPRLLQCAEFCRAALESIEQINTTSGADTVIAHSDEGAMYFVMRNGNRSPAPAVFWLHSLYDPPIEDFSNEQRRLLPSQSLLASAVMMAEIVVTSKGILKDAEAFDWPDRLKELQRALLNASAEHRVLTVESVGCLPVVPKTSATETSFDSNLDALKNLTSPYVLFPCRPMIDKGVGIFAAIAERLRAANIAFVAVRAPGQSLSLPEPFRNGLIHWLPWLSQEDLLTAMRHAACTVLPSITEGFGLAAAESISAGVQTLYHEVGGHHGLREHPHAQRVPLTTTEREQLYRLWSDLIVTNPDSWAVWTRYESSLRPLVDKWVDSIRSTISKANGATAEMRKPERAREPQAEEQWGNRLRRRIEMENSVSNPQ